MTIKNQRTSFTMWQNCYEDEAVPEPALLITCYYGTISVQQGNESILLNTASLNEFIKNLRKAAKEGIV